MIINNITFNKELSNGEDGLFNFISYSKANKIYFTKDITYNYRTNLYSTCKIYSDDLNVRFSKLLVAYKELFASENIYTYDTLLSLFSLRIFYRLIRKYYSHCESFKEFKVKHNDKTNDIYDELFSNLNIRDCDSKKSLVLILYK